MTRTMRWPVFAVILLAILSLPVIAQAQHKWSWVHSDEPRNRLDERWLAGDAAG